MIWITSYFSACFCHGCTSFWSLAPVQTGARIARLHQTGYIIIAVFLYLSRVLGILTSVYFPYIGLTRMYSSLYFSKRESYMAALSLLGNKSSPDSARHLPKSNGISLMPAAWAAIYHVS